MSETLTIHPKHDVSAFADSEACRYALGCVHYDPERKEVAATDARVMAIAKVDNGPDVAMNIPAHEIAAIKSVYGDDKRPVYVTPDGQKVRLQSNGENGIVTIVAEQTEGRFPRYPDVIPDAGRPHVKIRLCPKLLKRICEHALKTEGDGCARLDFNIAIERDGEGLAAAVLIAGLVDVDSGPSVPTGVTYILMPCRE